MLHVLPVYNFESKSLYIHSILHVFCSLCVNHNIYLFVIMYTYNMPSYNHVYVCSIVYICKYCVCPHGPYGLLEFVIKLSYQLYLKKIIFAMWA